MTARTACPPAVAEALISAQLTALESALKAYRRRVLYAIRNPLDDRGITGLERTLVAAAALDRAATTITEIQESTR